jgi:beta-glucuronidase
MKQMNNGTCISPEAPSVTLDIPRVMGQEPDPMCERLFRTTTKRTQKSLAGPWDFLTDPGDLGESQEFFRTLPAPEARLLVPGSWNTEARYYMYHGPAWYSRTFNVDKDTPVRIHFGCIYMLSKVWLDGELVAESSSAYSPVDIHLPRLAVGTHRLTVRCDNRMTECTLPKTCTDWFHFGGIPRPIFMEQIADHFIERVHVMPMRSSMNGTTLKVTIDTRNLTAKSVVSKVAVEIDGQSVLTDQVEAGPDRNQFTFEIPLSGVRLWSPADPQLYTIRVVLDDDDQIDRFGVRWLETEARKILLNGEQFKIKGANRHDDHPEWGPALPERILRRDFEILKRLNANACRVHYPPSKMTMDLCDEQGLVMFTEIPAWQNGHQLATAEGIEQMRSQLEALILRDRNHPSIICWSLGNEWVWSAEDTDDGDTVYRNIESLVAYVKSIDQSQNRFVSAVTGGAEINRLTELYDIILTNWGVYGWYRNTSTPVLTADDKEEQFEKLRRIAREFPGKPVVITEYGSAESIAGYMSWGNEKWSENFQAGNVHDSARHVLDDEDVSGGLVWHLYDVRSHYLRLPKDRPKGLNNKGILDVYRSPKLAFFRLQEVYADYP